MQKCSGNWNASRHITKARNYNLMGVLIHFSAFLCKASIHENTKIKCLKSTFTKLSLHLKYEFSRQLRRSPIKTKEI